MPAKQGLSMGHTAGLASRGLDPVALAAKFGLRSERGAGGEALIIPYLRGGEEVHHKARTSLVMGEGGGKQWQAKTGLKLFYNEDVLRRADLKGQPLIIVEGEPDLWACDQAGHERVVSVPDGAPIEQIQDLSSVKYDFLNAAWELLNVDNVPEIILAVDGDAAGANLMHDLSVRLGRARCKFINWPMVPERAREAVGRMKCKDLGEVMYFYGPKGVTETLKRATWIKVNNVHRMSELPPLPTPVVMDNGFPLLRESYRVRLGDFAVVTGIPGHGKTTFANDLSCRLVWEYSTDTDPLRIGFASFEQVPQRDHRRNLRAWFGKKHVKAMSDLEIANADMWIDEHFRFIVPSEDDDVTLEWMLEKMEAAVIQHGCRVIVIDPWNEMDHDRAPGENITEYTGRGIKALRRFARKFQIHLMVLAHPTKMQKLQDGNWQKPTLYNISDSAHWYNKADVGIVVHRNGNNTEIDVQKTKYHDVIGSPGCYDAVYNAPERRYDILARL
jgi:twinkle protein